MSSFRIEGGHPLRGEVVPSGNKNAALPLLAACLLIEEPVVLHNLPDIGDVRTMRSLLESLGVSIEPIDDHTWRVDTRAASAGRLDPELCRRMRASVLLAGPLTARAGQASLPPPGGDVIGRRRVDTHLLALHQMGAEYGYSDGEFRLRAPKGLHGADVLLDEASVTATENAVMAAVTARGQTVIRNAASEPHVQDLCHFLNRMGASIENIGSNTLRVEGVARLRGGEYAIGPDYLEVVSFIGAAAVTGGELRVRNAAPQHLGMVQLVLGRLGVEWTTEGEDVVVPPKQSLKVVPDLRGRIPQISVMPWPAFPTDLMSIAIVVATIGCLRGGCSSSTSWCRWERASCCAIRTAASSRGQRSSWVSSSRAPTSAPVWRWFWRPWPPRDRPRSATSVRSTAATSGSMTSFANSVPTLSASGLSPPTPRTAGFQLWAPTTFPAVRPASASRVEASYKRGRVISSASLR
jgi:UDP-N-acetylglucosamine 1-carboxyvinyltransferase